MFSHKVIKELPLRTGSVTCLIVKNMFRMVVCLLSHFFYRTGLYFCHISCSHDKHVPLKIGLMNPLLVDGGHISTVIFNGLEIPCACNDL